MYLVAPDDDRRTIYVNPQVERTLGYTRQEWLAQPDIWMELLHPGDREPTLAAHDLHNRTGQPWNRDYRLIASDGSAVWFRDMATLIRDAEGRPLYWHGMQTDITALKRVEEDLRAARDDLERRVEERTVALEEANALMSLEIGERRRTEAELKEAERRYRLLAEQIPAVTYTWDLGQDQEDAYTSPRIKQLLGYSVDEWHQSPDFWMARIHPDDRTRSSRPPCARRRPASRSRPSAATCTRTGTSCGCSTRPPSSRATGTGARSCSRASCSTSPRAGERRRRPVTSRSATGPWWSSSPRSCTSRSRPRRRTRPPSGT